MTISVIVPHRNGRSLLERCLLAIEQQNASVPFEIIVVADGSTDDSLAFVQERYPHIRTIASSANIGFAAACNLGARHAQGVFLAFLNNDARPYPSWLARLHRTFDGPDTVGLATSMILHVDGTIDSAGDGYLRCGGAFKHRHGEDVVLDEVMSSEAFGACGAAFMIRRSLFEALGGFDEDFFMVYEDVDLSYRARLLGASCVVVPGAVVEHVGGASLANLSSTAVFLGQRNLEWTYFKNTPSALLVRTLPAHLLYTMAAGVGYLMVGHGRTYIRAKLAAVAGLTRVWAKRRDLQRLRRIEPAVLASHMESGWVRRKLREKRFDWKRAAARSRLNE